MSALDLSSARVFYGETCVRTALTTSVTYVVTNVENSGELYRINEIIVSNIDGVNAADVTVEISRAGVLYAIVQTISVPADSSLPVLAKEIGIYLEEGDAIAAFASAAGDLDISVSYEIFSGDYARVNTSGLALRLDAADYNSFDRRTNLFTYSEDFNNAAWTKSGVTITTNATPGPVVNGVRLSADKLVETAVTQQFLIVQNPYTAVLNDVNTISVYAKSGERTQLTITSFGDGYAVFNLNTGTIYQTGGHVCSITSVGDGWYRCRATITEANVTTSNWYIGMWKSNTNSYLGTVGEGLFVAGAQFERNKSYLSNYVKTVASTVTDSTIWKDLTVNVNNGTLTNGPTFNVSNNGVISFTAASSHYVSVADTDLLSPSTISVEAWVYFTVLGTRIIYCGKGAGGSAADTEYWLEKTAANQFSIYFSNGTSSQNHLLASSSVLLNVWYHVVGTFDGSTMRGYVNGVQDSATFSLSGSIVNTGAAYAVGRLGTLASLYHSGYIGVNRIYNRALSATEILENFNAEKARFGL
jgi:hypothetical protein